VRLDVKPHGIAIADVRAGAVADGHHLLEPAVEKGSGGELLGAQVHPQHLVAVERLKLLGHLLARLPVDHLPLALAADNAQVNRGTPEPIALALIDRALAMSTSLPHHMLPSPTPAAALLTTAQSNVKIGATTGVQATAASFGSRLTV